MIPAFDNPDLTSDIAKIEEKREVLQQVIDIARAIENMQESLDSVLTLGLPSQDMPAHAMALYETVSENLKSLPVNKIKEYQENLEKIVRNQLNTILGYAGVDFDSDEDVEVLTLSSGSTGQTALDLLEDFRRTAQTTVSLRVLLRKRGVATPGAQLSVPKTVIENQLAELKVQEQQQRKKVEHKIEEMRNDIQVMIENPAYPENMKTMLRGVQQNLTADIDRLQKGAPLNRLSLVVDTEEIVASGVVEEAEEIEIHGVEEEGKKAGLTHLASRWLNSPWDVSWDDVKQSDD